MIDKHIRGIQGENVAVDFLRKQGFLLVGRNIRIGRSEIDIIAQRNDEIHFVEVKTRKVGSMVAPEETLNERKAGAVRRAVSAYMAMNDCMLEPRISLVAIDMAGDEVVDLRFIEDVIEYGW